MCYGHLIILKMLAENFSKEIDLILLLIESKITDLELYEKERKLMFKIIQSVKESASELVNSLFR